MLTTSQLRIIAERLASGLEVSEVAARLGVGLGYIVNLQKDPAFQELLAEIEAGSVPAPEGEEDLRQRVLDAAPDAISVMIELMQDTRQSGSVRQKAAEWVLAREASIAAMESHREGAPLIQQILLDHRSSQALERLVSENDGGEAWLKRLQERSLEMPPSTG